MEEIDDIKINEMFTDISLKISEVVMENNKRQVYFETNY